MKVAFAIKCSCCSIAFGHLGVVGNSPQGEGKAKKGIQEREAGGKENTMKPERGIARGGKEGNCYRMKNRAVLERFGGNGYEQRQRCYSDFEGIVMSSRRPNLRNLLGHSNFLKGANGLTSRKLVKKIGEL